MNAYGCKPIYNTNITSEDPYRPIRPETVDDCLLTYDLVEVIHSGLQCVLAVKKKNLFTFSINSIKNLKILFQFFGILGAILISYIFLDEDDRCKFEFSF